MTRNKKEIKSELKKLIILCEVLGIETVKEYLKISKIKKV